MGQRSRLPEPRRTRRVGSSGRAALSLRIAWSSGRSRRHARALARAAPHDLIVVQGCCHNPTGVDLTPAQWEQVAVAAARRPVLVVVDLAYQGFGSGLEPDRAAVDALLRAGAAFLVCVSFSKNMALYGERAGALLVPGPRLGAAVESRLAAAARRLWSSAPRLASELVAEILSTTSLRARWQTELELMAARVADIRERLAHQLATDAVPVDTDGLLAQRGLFWWSGLDRGVIARLRERHGIHVLDNGRVNLGGSRAGHRPSRCGDRRRDDTRRALGTELSLPLAPLSGDVPRGVPCHPQASEAAGDRAVASLALSASSN